MSFAWPKLLWLLLVPLALLAWELTRRRRAAAVSHPKILRAEAGARALEFKGTDAQPRARAKPRFWLCLGLALVIGALARPQWGRLEEPVFDQSREILLAIDLSRSMLTPDVPPSRLARSKLLIQSLLEKLQGERVGLAVFAGTSFLQSPLSADYEILREFLPALGPDFLPQGGTNYRALIETGIAAFGTSNTADRFLIILSDGEATDEDWKERIPELKQKGIRVIGLGIGTPGGGMIPDGSGGFVKDERGAVVLSKLENSTLQELAQATGGVYRDASSWLDLAALIKETVEAGQKGKFVEKNTVRLAERFQWPLAFGLWCLLVSFFSEFPVRPRPRDIKLTAHPSAPKATADKLAATAAAVLVLLSAIRFSPPSIAAETPAAPTSPAAPLAKIVGRVSASESRTARDWSEFGHETVIWGSHLQGDQQPVPEGPVKDALAAVDTGSKLDPKATDWEKLRQDLEALLQKPEDKKQDQKDQKQNQDQKNQDQKDQQQKQDQQKSDQQQSDKKDQQQQKQEQKSNEQKQPGESAFGDMQKKDQPPPPPPPQDSGTQKVGGEKRDQPPEQVDPSLALPLQKLDQLRNQDSPAQLFQLMDGEKKPGQKKAGKDW